jgi:ERCC4-type nuclease
MDVHEKGGMKELVRGACEDVNELDGFGGDYAVGGHLIERKRWEEVAGRMTESDRNLFYQLDKLTSAADELGVEPALLLEVESDLGLEHSRLPEHQMAKYLAGTARMGVQVILSTGQRCTASILADLEDGTPPDVRRVRGTPDGDEHAARFVIEGFQGIGPSTAEALLEHLGTVEDVVSATEEELTSVPGVGPATAGKIIDVRGRGA